MQVILLWVLAEVTEEEEEEEELSASLAALQQFGQRVSQLRQLEDLAV